jgi:Fur family ferric uptake transcriptional regulator
VHVTTESLVSALRSAGIRVTHPRRAVCEVVARHHGDHLTAAAITERLAGAADQSTVYRTLDVLEQAGVLTHSHLGHGPSVYHLADDEPHQHLVCDVCGRAFAFDLGVLEAPIAQIRRDLGFVVDPAHFALSGRCARCVAANPG